MAFRYPMSAGTTAFGPTLLDAEREETRWSPALSAERLGEAGEEKRGALLFYSGISDCHLILLSIK